MPALTANHALLPITDELYPLDRWYHRWPFSIGVPTLLTMSLVRTFRYWQQPHVSFVRCAMLLVLLSVIAAGVPRWIVHAHTADHASISVVALDGHTLDAHDDDSGDATEPTPDGTHLHGHYIVTFSSLLPSVLMIVAADGLRSQRCPPGQISSPCEGHLVTLHRPPIA